MRKTAAQVRAILEWEAACERLRNSIEPPHGAPAASGEERFLSFLIVKQALASMGQAFDIDTPHLSLPSDPRFDRGDADESPLRGME